MGDQSLVIRDAVLADVDGVRAVLVRTWHATYDAIYGAERVRQITDNWHSRANLQSQVGKANCQFLVAELQTKIIGTAFASSSEGQTRLHRLYVLPEHKGCGFGYALLSSILVGLNPNERIDLEVEPQNFAAIAFYERQGFRVVSETRNCGAESSGIRALIMTRFPD